MARHGRFTVWLIRFLLTEVGANRHRPLDWGVPGRGAAMACHGPVPVGMIRLG